MREKIIILLIVISVMVIGGPAWCENISSIFNKHEVAIGYTPFCEHIFSDNTDYNENDNHLIILSVDQWFVMTFKNSYYDRAFAAGYTFRTGKWKPFEESSLTISRWETHLFLRGNLSAGLVYGYHNRTIELWGISPAAIPSLEVGYKNFSVHATVYPIGTLVFTWTF